MEINKNAIVLLIGLLILTIISGCLENQVICNRPYILGDGGECCKDIDENNVCDPSDLKFYIGHSGVKGTDVPNVQIVYAEFCNSDEYDGRVIAYYGELSSISRDGYDIWKDFKNVPETYKEKLLKEEVYLVPGECHEFEFSSVYNPSDMKDIVYETYPIVEK